MNKLKLVADPYPPYQFEENGIIRGIDCDMICKALNKKGYRVDIELMEWEDCLKKVDKGEADGIFQLVRTPEREKTLAFSEVLRVGKTVFFKRKDTEFELSDGLIGFENLGFCRIGILKGYSYSNEIDTLEINRKVEASTPEDLINGLIDSKYELMLIDYGVCEYILRKHGIGDIEKVSGYEIERNLYVGFRNDISELRDIFNESLRELKQKGYYRDIFCKYGIKPEVW